MFHAEAMRRDRFFGLSHRRQVKENRKYRYEKRPTMSYPHGYLPRAITVRVVKLTSARNGKYPPSPRNRRSIQRLCVQGSLGSTLRNGRTSTMKDSPGEPSGSPTLNLSR